MGIGSRVFESQYAALAEARAKLRIDRDIVEQCLCGSFQTTRTATDEGLYDAIVASVKLKKTAWPSRERPEGKIVEFMRDSESEWTKCRVVGVSETDGIFSLILQAEFA